MLHWPKQQNDHLQITMTLQNYDCKSVRSVQKDRRAFLLPNCAFCGHCDFSQLETPGRRNHVQNVHVSPSKTNKVSIPQQVPDLVSIPQQVPDQKTTSSAAIQSTFLAKQGCSPPNLKLFLGVPCSSSLQRLERTRQNAKNIIHLVAHNSGIWC